MNGLRSFRSIRSREGAGPFFIRSGRPLPMPVFLPLPVCIPKAPGLPSPCHVRMAETTGLPQRRVSPVVLSILISNRNCHVPSPVRVRFVP